MKGIVVAILCVTLYGCIDSFDIDGTEQYGGMLVVYGTISNGETQIRLSRSYPIHTNINERNWVDNATVYVQRGDGVRYTVSAEVENGLYRIPVDRLDEGMGYKLHIAVDGEVYESEALEPVFTPEIDELVFSQQDREEPVYISVSTSDPDNIAEYYSWSFEEIWEIQVRFRALGYLDELDVWTDYTQEEMYAPERPYYCWKYGGSRSLLLGSSADFTGSGIRKTIHQTNHNDRRFSVLYYIKVRQNAMRKQAYDYFSNVIKNSEDVGGIFSPMPSELDGNIVCVSNPGIPAIGYVEVAESKWIEKFVEAPNEFYEVGDTCLLYEKCNDDRFLTDEEKPIWKIYLEDETPKGLCRTYSYNECIDCTYRTLGGVKTRPEWWPNDHY